MPTLEPIVVNAPKEKKTYTYSENDIVDIVAQAIKQGKIEAGAGFEEVEVKLYFSDFDLSTPLSPKLSNQEKIAIIDEICGKCKDGKLVLCALATPTYGTDPNTIYISGSMSNFSNALDNDYVCGFGLPTKFQQLSDPTYSAMLIKSANVLLTLMDIPSPTDLFTLMATDTTKYVSLKFRVEK